MDCYSRHPEGGVHCSMCKVINSCRRTTRERLSYERKNSVERFRYKQKGPKYLERVKAKLFLELTFAAAPRNTSEIIDDVRNHWKNLPAGHDMVSRALKQLRLEHKIHMFRKGSAHYWMVVTSSPP
jgi:hypothetical protein